MEDKKVEKKEELNDQELEQVAGGQTVRNSNGTFFETSNPDPWGVTQPGGPNRYDGDPEG